VATAHHAHAPGRHRPGLLRRFVGPAWDELTYRRLAYLLLALPFGLGYFLFLVGGLAFSASMVFALVGIPMLYGMLLAWRGLSELERTFARGLLGMEIASPPAPLSATSWRGLRSRLTDPLTWKGVVFLFVKLPVGLLSFLVPVVLLGSGLVLVAAPFALGGTVTADMGFWSVDSRAEALALAPLGVLLVLVGLHAVNGLAWVSTHLVEVMLAPAPDAELRERVAAVQGSRVRIIEAADAERRRIERDLHDGAQQRLVALSLSLGLARSKLPDDPDAASGLIEEARAEAGRALTELRELARGIHPAVLTDHGLEAALGALASRSPVPVEVEEVPEERLPPAVESTAYFLVSEALANMAKHSQASEATVRVRLEPGRVVVEVADDGVGGATSAGGTGLRGLADRVEALDGRLEVSSPPGGGTCVRAELPLA
jgi:signal transduction histidine kinase